MEECRREEVGPGAGRKPRPAGQFWNPNVGKEPANRWQSMQKVQTDHRDRASGPEESPTLRQLSSDSSKRKSVSLGFVGRTPAQTAHGGLAELRKISNIHVPGAFQVLSIHELISSSQQPHQVMLLGSHFTEEETESQGG